MGRGRKPTILPDAGAFEIPATPPARLSKDAKLEWRRVVPALNKRGTIREADVGMLESYCTAIGRIWECQRIIAKDGPTLGNRKHPAVAIQHDAMTLAKQLAAELGLTPASRSRPAMRGDEDDLEFLD